MQAYSLTTEQAARFLKISERDLVRWIRGEGLRLSGIQQTYSLQLQQMPLTEQDDFAT
ncbi:hypothetical protein JCM19233_5651 [Vibrio astriarenae]|nr:hypothetical protein JCM19233_5651 [Vibrio sp. C7]